MAIMDPDCISKRRVKHHSHYEPNSNRNVSYMMDDGRCKSEDVNWSMHPAMIFLVCCKHVLVHDEFEVAAKKKGRYHDDGKCEFGIKRQINYRCFIL